MRHYIVIGRRPAGAIKATVECAAYLTNVLRPAIAACMRKTGSVSASQVTEDTRQGPVRAARPLVLALAAPFIGLACVTAVPIAGLVAIAWIGGTALLKT